MFSAINLVVEALCSHGYVRQTAKGTDTPICKCSLRLMLFCVLLNLRVGLNNKAQSPNGFKRYEDVKYFFNASLRHCPSIIPGPLESWTKDPTLQVQVCAASEMRPSRAAV
eukprot:1204286-Amphidinium_carterae.1